jgi:DNA-binding NtrC family response regulator
VASINDALREEHYDVILLSTNINGQDFYPVIKRYKKSIIILMVSYISNDTVTIPLKNGANDYIQKPFMIEELARKINHFSEHNAILKQNEMYTNYMNYIFKSMKTPKFEKNLTLPCLIRVNNKKVAEHFVFEYAKATGSNLELIDIDPLTIAKTIKESSGNAILYLLGFSNLKKSDQQKVIGLIQGRDIFLSNVKSEEEQFEIETIDLNEDDIFFERGEILSIDDYIRYIIKTFQHKFPDTELSKKLGISRKSLWEKRKKYEIFKRK